MIEMVSFTLVGTSVGVFLAVENPHRVQKWLLQVKSKPPDQVVFLMSTTHFMIFSIAQVYLSQYKCILLSLHLYIKYMQ